MPEAVIYEVVDRVARITLNRPDRRNAINRNVVEGLTHALDEAEADDRVRVMVLTGAGDVFSAGADLEELKVMEPATDTENLADSERLARLFERIYRTPKPVIARVNGHAIAGGCGLAAVCDFSIVADHARLGFTEVRIGFVPAIVSVFVLRKVGEAAARDLLLRGRLLTAAEAAEIGLVTRAVSGSALDQAVDELAAELARETSATAVALTKKVLAEVRDLPLSEALSNAARVNAFARTTKDCRTGIAAFLSKTAPPWKR
jgi:methylglutaconyl-CoA hydratase